MKSIHKGQRIRPWKPFAKKQNGMALIMVLVVLLVLTLVGLASTDSSNFQALMVRNNQFRLEAFNTSYTEIESQLTTYRTDAGKAILFKAVDGVILSSTGISPTQTSTPILDITENDAAFTKEVMLSKIGGSPMFEESLGGYKKCHILLIDSDSNYINTSIGSDQSQQFSFLSY